MKRYYIYLAIFLSFANIASAQVMFTDVAEGLGFRVGDKKPTAAVWGDYDNDGDADLFLFTSLSKVLYRNEGDIFYDVTQPAGIIDSSPGASTAIFLDFDNDGDLDLFMGGEGSTLGDILYQNNFDGTFLNISQAAGMKPIVRTYFGSISFDFDNDGLLDIYTANAELLFADSPPNFFYHNESNGHFREMAAQLGLDGPKLSDGIALGDYDNDGDIDIFIATATEGAARVENIPPDAGFDALYRNDGGGIFVDVAQQAGVHRRAFHKNAFFWDYDNDGDLDIFIHSWPSAVASETNVLFKNNGNGMFTDVTSSAGILPSVVNSSGAYCGDYDNDGWLDLCVTYHNSPTFLYHNNGDGTFKDVSKRAGIAGTNSGTVSFVDYDNDGDLDIFTGESPGGSYIALYRNEGTSYHWLQLKLVGEKSNRDAIGARVKLSAGGLKMLREVTGCSGGWYGNKQDRLPVHFGLGTNVRADMIEIRWPSGVVQTFKDVPADQRITIDEFDGIVTIAHKVIPGSGVPSGGTPVRIQGENFIPGSKVLFGRTEARYVEVQTPTLITAVTPPGVKGFVDVEVISPDGKAGILKNGFLYSSIQITKLTPISCPITGGIQVQIEGSGFQKGAVVKIGENLLVNTLVTPVLIQVTLPASKPGKVDVSVTNPDGEIAILKRYFTYNSPPAIEEVRPDIGPLMRTEIMNIDGSGFMRIPTVHVGGIASQKITFVSSGVLEVEIPFINTIGPQDVVVINPDGQRAVIPGGLAIMAPPKIKKVEPDSGSLEGGTEITITGDDVVEFNNKTYPTKFYEPMKVLIGGVECPEVKVESDHVIKAVTPSNTPGAKDITVIDSLEQDDTLRDAFTYNTAPQISRITPNNGRLSGGTRITIQGSGFQPGAEVIIVSESGVYLLLASQEFISPNAITAVTVSSNPGLRDVIVRNPDKQYAILPGGFTYNPMPAVASISPGYGSSADSTKLLIQGSGFLRGAKMMIGEFTATTEVESDMTIRAVIPPIPQGVWDVRVINPDTQEAIRPRGFISVGEVVYNYPNPFQANQGTTFRYVTDQQVQSVTVRIFNLAGVPIDVVQQLDSNEVRWQNSDIHVGLYVYMMEVVLSDGKRKQFRNMLEVCK